jgi:hypothetical protein
MFEDSQQNNKNMKLETIAIIPAPIGSQIVVGPWDINEEDSVCFSPCAFLALISDRHGERHVVPVGFGDEMDAELTHHTATLEPSIDEAQKEVNRRIKAMKSRAAKQ